MVWIVDGRRVIVRKNHLVGLLGIITSAVEGCGQVARHVLTLVGVRWTSDFRSGVNPRRCQRLHTNHVDHEERVETVQAEQKKKVETSERKRGGRDVMTCAKQPHTPFNMTLSQMRVHAFGKCNCTGCEKRQQRKLCVRQEVCVH